MDLRARAQPRDDVAPFRGCLVSAVDPSKSTPASRIPFAQASVASDSSGAVAMM